ncbi:MAG TPA: cupin domain-containing protein [Solirubrobacterales bacterium]|nr:cupin domain-containing protein [Solirubrobacterales bacterium]
MSGPGTIVVASPATVELAPSELDPATVVSGSPRTFEGEIATAQLPGGGTLATGVWRCTEGTVTDVEADETFVVLSGRATIDHDGASHEVGPGDVCVLPAGAETRWTVHETITKVFVIVEEE